MSDYETIKEEAAWDAVLEARFYERQAMLQENAEAALLELFPKVDPDVLMEAFRSRDEYGDPFNSFLIGLTEALQKKLTETSEQLKSAHAKALGVIKQKADERWSDIIKAAIALKRKNPKLKNTEVARRVIANEMQCEDFTTEEQLERLKERAINSLRRKLSKNAKFNAIK